MFCCTLPLTNPETDRPSIRSILHLQSEIVCGDTSGNVHFWDAQFGSQLNAFQKHEADVTQLRCIDRRYLIASGSDATVTIYHKEDSESDWKYVHLRRPHVHDVQDLLFFVKDRFQALMTASRDGLVRFATCGRNEDVVQSFLKQRLEPLTLLPENPRFRLRPQPFRNVLAVHAFHVDLWKLPADPVPSFATSLDEKRSAEPSLLFRLQSTGGQGLTAAALSPDGRFCVLSTRSCSKWIRIEDLEKQPRFQNVSSTNNVPSALDLHFSMDSKWLFLLDFENRMSVVDTERRKTLHQWKLQTPENERPFLLHPKHLTFSKDDSHFVYHIDGNVFLYLRNGESPRNGNALRKCSYSKGCFRVSFTAYVSRFGSNHGALLWIGRLEIDRCRKRCASSRSRKRNIEDASTDASFSLSFHRCAFFRNRHRSFQREPSFQTFQWVAIGPSKCRKRSNALFGRNGRTDDTFYRSQLESSLFKSFFLWKELFCRFCRNCRLLFIDIDMEREEISFNLKDRNQIRVFERSLVTCIVRRKATNRRRVLLHRFCERHKLPTI